MTLKELFNDWVEPDVAQYYLACLLGLMAYDSTLAMFKKNSSIFHVRNELGTMLFQILEEIVKGGVLESNELGQYRWNNSGS